MNRIDGYLLTFLLNSLWQVPLAAAVAALICRAMRNGPARYRHMVWVAALAAAILLPLASTGRGRSDQPTLAVPQATLPMAATPDVEAPAAVAGPAAKA